MQARGLGALEKITPGIPGIELTTLSKQGVSGVVRVAHRCQPAAIGLLTLTQRDNHVWPHSTSNAELSDLEPRIPNLAYRRFLGRLLGISSRPRTTSPIGAMNKRQMRSNVRSVMGFPASTFCQ